MNELLKVLYMFYTNSEIYTLIIVINYEVIKDSPEK